MKVRRTAAAPAQAIAVGSSTAAAGSFEDFYRARRSQVHRAIGLTLGDWDLAAQAVDEAMLRTYVHWDRVGEYQNPAGFAYRVGVNWARSAARKLRRLVRAVPDQAVTDPPPSDPALLEAVRALPHSMRSVLVCRYFLDLSTDETASALHISPGTVKSRLSRSLTRLRERLEVER